jgi:multiple sugar transport system substrate-binding protein
MTLIKILKNSALGLAAFGFVAAASPTYAADLVMWERSGGNKDMVDKLVEMWNAKFPDRHINLTYIPHAEMVAKLAQAIASGDVPDLMGMDLIYAPQFEKAGQLVDLTDLIGNLPELKTASPGHMMVATFDKRIYGVPLYADVSALFYNKDLFYSKKRASTPTSRRRAYQNSARTPTRSPLSGATLRATISRAPARAATSSPSVP